MHFLSHSLFALTLGLFFRYQAADPVLFVVLVLLGSFIPDIDSTTSTFGKHMKFVGFLLGHRGLLHSMWLLFLLLFISPLALGYGSHLFLDGLTRKGIKPFFPFAWKVKGPFKTGGTGEYVMLVVFSLLCVFFLFL